MCLHVARLVDRAHDVGSRLLAKAFHLSQFADVASQFVDVSILADPSQVDKLRECLFGDAVDVHALLRHKAGKLTKLFGWTFTIGAVERLRTTDLAYLDNGRSVTYQTLVRNAE